MVWKGGVAAMLVALGSVTSGRAAAADVATLSCVVDNIPQAAKTALADSAHELVGGGANRPPQEARAAVESAAIFCQQRHGWSGSARDAAKTGAMTEVALTGLAPLLAEHEFDLDDFREAIASLSPDQRDLILEKDDATIEALLAALKAEGVATKDKRGLELIGVVAVFVIYADRARRTFVDS